MTSTGMTGMVPHQGTLELAARMAQERGLTLFASELRDLGKPVVKIRLKTVYVLRLDKDERHEQEFDSREAAENFVRRNGCKPEMDYSDPDDEVVNISEADILPEPENGPPSTPGERPPCKGFCRFCQDELAKGRE